MTVFGGSLGARSINLAAFDAFTAERGLPHDHVGQPWVLHVAGRRDYAELRRRWDEQAQPGALHADRVRARPRRRARRCDLVVARAGGSVFEIAAAGRPAILVPYPHATADHQTANARWMADGGAAVVIPDAELTAERLSARDRRAARRRGRLRAMSAASRRLAKPDAAERIAGEVLAAARWCLSRWRGAGSTSSRSAAPG